MTSCERKYITFRHEVNGRAVIGLVNCPTRLIYPNFKEILHSNVLRQALGNRAIKRYQHQHQKFPLIFVTFDKYINLILNKCSDNGGRGRKWSCLWYCKRSDWGETASWIEKPIVYIITISQPSIKRSRHQMSKIPKGSVEWRTW